MSESRTCTHREESRCPDPGQNGIACGSCNLQGSQAAGAFVRIPVLVLKQRLVDRRRHGRQVVKCSGSELRPNGCGISPTSCSKQHQILRHNPHYCILLILVRHSTAGHCGPPPPVLNQGGIQLKSIVFSRHPNRDQTSVLLPVTVSATATNDLSPTNQLEV